MSQNLKEPSLPQNPQSDFDRRLSIMLYEYLRDLRVNYNALRTETDSSDAQRILANRVFAR